MVGKAMNGVSEEASKLVEDLALEGCSERRIFAALRRQGIDGVLAKHEVAEIVNRVRAARQCNPRVSGSKLPRMIGLLAVALGGASILFAGGPLLGWVAAFFGLVLVIAPWAGAERIGRGRLVR